ncbi:MAG: UDP-N-acetylmuramoyl-L-alanine--D-glutamate ligase, partial [Candidatus Aminicenantes bacterium]|nr:UDP-N-acetylmuramoyl-L-alanine--D-glutamate ligase [Candidatus Aminicenantes bacterium]
KMNLEGKRVLVIGLGKTGRALSSFLVEQKALVKVSEKNPSEKFENDLDFWASKGVTIETGSHNLSSFMDADLIIPSPGVPMLPEMVKARAEGIPIISEVELASCFLKGKIVGITGSNGKSTTATLTHKILKEGRIEAFLAGNIGTPLISFVQKSMDNHVYVTELSSFQLEHIEHFSASVSVFLNLSPDHLDWHKDIKGYFEAKKKLLLSQKESGMTILNRDDPEVWALAEEAPTRVMAFSRQRKIQSGCSIQENWLVLRDKKEEKIIKVSDIPLLGVHNLDNVMASALVGHLFSVPVSSIRESIKNFKGLEHRLEKVSNIRGVEFYNDSKATNVEAAITSIGSFNQPIILILGGRDKGGDFKKLRTPVQEKVKKVLLIGEAKEKIKNDLNNDIPMSYVTSLEEAVVEGFASADPGEIVLLAPACTSFDMFRNFEDRGNIFKKEVFSLKEKINNA